MNNGLITICLTLLMLVASGCNRLQNTWSNAISQSAAVDFVIDEVTAAGQTGNFLIKGRASLPDETQLAVSAVRSLQAASAPEADSEKPSYAILDRTFTKVEEGRFEAQLALKQLDANGTGFESWQFDIAALQNQLTPSPTVIFLVTLEPSSFSTQIEQLLTNGGINEGNTQLSFTTEGDAYLQIGQSVSVPIPSGTAVKGSASALAPTDDIWQGRSTYTPNVSDLSGPPQLPFAEEDDLFLPADNMMQ